MLFRPASATRATLSPGFRENQREASHVGEGRHWPSTPVEANPPTFIQRVSARSAGGQ
jgi:hypothetical protein